MNPRKGYKQYIARINKIYKSPGELGIKRGIDPKQQERIKRTLGYSKSFERLENNRSIHRKNINLANSMSSIRK